MTKLQHYLPTLTTSSSTAHEIASLERQHTMNRKEAIEHIWQTTQQVIQEFCVYPSEIDEAESECMSALLTLGVTSDEIARAKGSAEE